MAQGTGFDLRSSFGSDLQRFLAFPSVAGTPSHGVVGTAGLIAVVALLIGGRAVVALGRHRGDWRNLLTGCRSDTTVIIQAAFVAFGLLLTAPGTYIYRHYLIVAWVLLPLDRLARAALAALGAPAARDSLRRSGSPLRGVPDLHPRQSRRTPRRLRCELRRTAPPSLGRLRAARSPPGGPGQRPSVTLAVFAGPPAWISKINGRFA